VVLVAVDVYKEIVAELHNESNIINQRMTWMTASLTILMTAFANLVAKTEPEQERYALHIKVALSAICMVGVFVPLLVLCGLCGAMLGEATWSTQLEALSRAKWRTLLLAHKNDDDHLLDGVIQRPGPPPNDISISLNMSSCNALGCCGGSWWEVPTSGDDRKPKDIMADRGILAWPREYDRMLDVNFRRTRTLCCKFSYFGIPIVWVIAWILCWVSVFS
jgi:hypothetical protein